MGKRRHAQDKMWVTQKEMVNEWGGKREEHEANYLNRDNKMARLPFNYCNFSLTAASDPYCAAERIPEGATISAPAIKFHGIVFDIMSIVPEIKTHGRNPITGTPLKQSDLVKLHFHKNDDGEFHCPVTFKLLTSNSHIIAIRETGNVFSYEAYQELNKDAKNYRDLLTDEKFDPKSIILINDPVAGDLVKRKGGSGKVNHSKEEMSGINQSLSARRILKDLDKTALKQH